MNTQPLKSLESFTVRYRIRAHLRTLASLRIGGGKSLDAATTGLPVLRDARGLPYVPGSSMKGLLRSGLEATLRGLPPSHRHLRTCNPLHDNLSEKKNDQQQLTICGAKAMIDLDAEGQPEADQKLDAVLRESCCVCGLFGSMHLASRVWIHDLRLCGESQSSMEVRDGVGIDRDLGIAAQGCKYDLETVPAGNGFQLEILLENVDDMQLALILDTLDSLDRGRLRLGSGTSRGLGRVAVETPSLQQLTHHRLINSEGWESLDYREELQFGQELLLETVTAKPKETQEN